MKKGLNILLGCGALLFALALNLNYAANDYGILENSLSTQVLAQSTTTGSNSNGSNSNGSDSGDSGGITNPWLWKYEKTDIKCTATIGMSGGFSVGVTTGSGASASMSQGWEHSSTFEGFVYKCVDGWSLFTCSSKCDA